MSIRDQAKLCFQKGKFSAAADAYTEAITQEPSNAALYQNRALCFQKLAKWDGVVQDAGKALELVGDSVKAHYLLATALSNLGRLDEAEGSFKTALSLATSPEVAGYRRSIEQGLFSLYASRKHAEEQDLEQNDEANRRIIDDLLHEAFLLEAQQVDENEASNRHVERTQKVFEMNDRICKTRARQAIPEALCCQITFDIMRDPVLTPAGHTYEREALEEHIRHNGLWDPVTRQPLQRSQIIKNLALQSIIQDFLVRNPWAYGS